MSLKRYRYTGKERDDETGFAYHGARYYAPWLGRWMSCDPAGLADGPNSYGYVGGNPIRRTDPTGMQGLDAEQVATEQIKTALGGASAYKFAISLNMGPLRMSYVRDKMIEAGILKRDGTPTHPVAQAPVTPPPAYDGPTIGPSTISREKFDQQVRERDRAEYRARHPNGYDVMRSDMEVVGKAVDPSGMGVIKGPVAVGLMAAGDDPATAYQKAGQADAVFSVLTLKAQARAAAGPGPADVPTDPVVSAEVRPIASDPDPAPAKSIWGQGSKAQAPAPRRT